MPKNPNRGEVWLIDIGMAAKVRPCLVMSLPLEDEDRALITIVPHTTSVYGSRFEVPVKAGFLKAGVFDAQNLVTIPRAKLIKKLGDFAAEQMANVERAVRFWLGLEVVFKFKNGRYNCCAVAPKPGKNQVFKEANGTTKRVSDNLKTTSYRKVTRMTNPALLRQFV